MKVSSGRRTGCGSRSNAGLLKKDIFRIERERKCESGREKRNVSFYRRTCVNVFPVLLNFACLLDANFSINAFHANFFVNGSFKTQGRH